MEAIPEQVVRWYRGDLSDSEFEPWIYANADLLESSLGKDLAMALIERDYRPGPPANEWPPSLDLRAELAKLLRRACPCLLFCDRQWLILNAGTASWIAKRCVQLRELTSWVQLVRCRVCGEHWLVGCDTVDDVWFLERISESTASAIVERDEWPATFDGWKHLWEPGTSLRPQTVSSGAFRHGVAGYWDFE